MTYGQGYYQAMDDVMKWLNAEYETDNKKFRSKLNSFCLKARPLER
jgi:hypothetical protein